MFFLAGALFCVITLSSSSNLIGVLIVFGFFVASLASDADDRRLSLSVTPLSVKSVALDAFRLFMIGESLTLFSENALPPNIERARLILLETSGLTDKLLELPNFVCLLVESSLPLNSKYNFSIKNVTAKN